MMKDKKKIQQPFRNPNEYSCYLEGVKAAAEALGYKVDSLTWGGGIPNDLTLYEPEVITSFSRETSSQFKARMKAEVNPDADTGALNAEPDSGT